MPYEHGPDAFIITKDTELSVIQSAPDAVVLQGEGILPENVAQLPENTTHVLLDAIADVNIVLSLPKTITHLTLLTNVPESILNHEVVRTLNGNIEWGTLYTNEEAQANFARYVQDLRDIIPSYTSISCYDMTAEQADKLIDALSHNKFVVSCKICAVIDGLSIVQVERLVAALVDSKVSELILESNQLTDEHAFILAAGFRTNPTINHVNLLNNSISEVGQQAIYDAFAGRDVTLRFYKVEETDNSVHSTHEEGENAEEKSELADQVTVPNDAPHFSVDEVASLDSTQTVTEAPKRKDTPRYTEEAGDLPLARSPVLLPRFNSGVGLIPPQPGLQEQTIIAANSNPPPPMPEAEEQAEV